MHLILHIPHSSAVIPPEYRGEFLLSDAQLSLELARMTDALTDHLFFTRDERLVFPVSRLVCDPERFRRDADERMAAKGMGAVYTHGSALQPLRRPADREAVLRRYYDPHHALLDAAAERSVRAFGHCLIVDCHSFSPVPLTYEDDRRPRRPDICLGTDDFHTPPGLAGRCAAYFCGRGLRVELNRPYAGALVPAARFRRDRRVLSIMVEVNRGLYLAPGGTPGARFGSVRRTLRGLLRELRAAPPPADEP